MTVSPRHILITYSSGWDTTQTQNDRFLYEQQFNKGHSLFKKFIIINLYVIRRLYHISATDIRGKH